jgi:hypothetical protein
LPGRVEFDGYTRVEPGYTRAGSQSLFRFSVSVYYVFAAAVGLLEEVAAGCTAERVLHVVPSANAVGTGSLALRVSPRRFKNTPAAARAILRDLMGAGQELFRAARPGLLKR